MARELVSGGVESTVRERYAEGATRQVAELCCQISYDPSLLEAIPDEVVERDYGCGDPSRHVQPGETVLDLGSGGGKACFIAAQIVGEKGSVIGVDMTPEMLDLARRNAPVVAENLGYSNVTFRRGRIQDLGLDLDAFDAALAGRTMVGVEGWLEADEVAARLRAEAPMLPDASIDVVVSNCVLNLVDPAAKGQMFREIARVLRPGGRAVISDIVADRAVPDALKKDAELWSGCLSGALSEEEFVAGFVAAGLSAPEVLARNDEPWQVVDEINFRSVTVASYRGLAFPSPQMSTSADACRGTDCC